VVTFRPLDPSNRLSVTQKASSSGEGDAVEVLGYVLVQQVASSAYLKMTLEAKRESDNSYHLIREIDNLKMPDTNDHDSDLVYTLGNPRAELPVGEYREFRLTVAQGTSGATSGNIANITTEASAVRAETYRSIGFTA
jgi:hypothetical protein